MTEGFQIFYREIAAVGEYGIKRRRDVSFGKNETIPIRSDLIDPVPARNRLFWKEEYENARTRAANEGKALRVRAALEKGAFSRHEAVTALAEEWKNEYRRMSR